MRMTIDQTGDDNAVCGVDDGHTVGLSIGKGIRAGFIEDGGNQTVLHQQGHWREPRVVDQHKAATDQGLGGGHGTIRLEEVHRKA